MTQRTDREAADRRSAVRLGVVGCGRAAATLHLPVLRSLPEVRVVALADPDPAALRRVSVLAPEAQHSGEPRELLDDPAIEALAICTPAAAHVELALAGLDAGKHLFIEKPLALELEACDRLLERAARAPQRVLVGFNTRWHRFARRARELVASGALGPLELVRSRLSSHHRDLPPWRRRRSTGGGVVLEMAMHHFDLWHFLSGAEVEEVTAATRSGEWEDEAAVIGARLSDGALASAVFCERTRARNSLQIDGREASLELSFYRFDGLRRTRAEAAPGSVGERLREALDSARGLPRALGAAAAGGEWRRSYREQWRHFAAAVRTGAAVECGLEDGRRALAVALAALESAARGTAVRVAR